MSDDRKSGLGAAVEALMPETDLLRAAELPFMKGEQLALLPVVKDEAADLAKRSGPGRPAGSRNKTTNDWRDYILANYRSPLLFLAETYTRPTVQLAAELGCSLERAYQIQQDAAEKLAPYVHQKQAISVEVDLREEMSLTIVPRSGAAPAMPGDLAKVISVEIEQDQDLSEDEPSRVGHGELDSDQKGEQ